MTLEICLREKTGKYYAITYELVKNKALACEGGTRQNADSGMWVEAREPEMD